MLLLLGKIKIMQNARSFMFWVLGIRADPMMFLAVNCQNVAKSEEFYAKSGFARQVSLCCNTDATIVDTLQRLKISITQLTV